MAIISKQFIGKICFLAVILSTTMNVSNAQVLSHEYENLPTMRNITGRPAGMGLRLR